MKPKRIASPPRSVSPVDWKAYKAAKAEKLEAEEAEEAKAKRAEQRKAKKGKSKFNKPAWDSDSEPDDDSADEYEQAMREQEELERNGGEFDMILQRDRSFSPSPFLALSLTRDDSIRTGSFRSPLPLLLCTTSARTLRSSTPNERSPPRSTDDSESSDDGESGWNEVTGRGDCWILFAAQRRNDNYSGGDRERLAD